MNRTHIIIGLLIVLVIIYLSQTQKRENLDAPNLSNEAIQNIASVYANTSGEAVFNNLRVTGTSNFNNLRVTGTSNLVPRGTIVAWNPPDGKLDKAPDTWAFCDGTNGTPDLRGRFILGNGEGTDLTERKLNDKGGEEEHKLTLDEIPTHDHNFNIVIGCSGNNCQLSRQTHDKILGNVGIKTDWITKKSTTGDWGYGIARQGNGIEYNFGINFEKNGKDKPHNNMPPYYVLAYIMKL